MDVNIAKQNEMSKSEAAIWFWTVVLAFAGIWIFLPSLFHSGYKSDVIEMQLVAKEWVLATRKHPMLPSWILEIINLLTNRSFVAPFIAASFCTIITLFSVWQLARQVLSEQLALIGTFSMLPFWTLTVESVNYNHNSTLIACWALTTLMFYNAFQTNKKRWWIAAGLTLGLGFHAKYTIVLLAFALLFYSLWFPKFRRYWKEIGPWITIATTFVVFLPHLICLYHIGFWSTTLYAIDNAIQEEVWRISSHFIYPIRWVACLLGLIIISPILLLLPSLGTKWTLRAPRSEIEKEASQYLLCCMALPFFVLFLIPLSGSALEASHGMPLCFFLGVYLLLRFQRRDSASVFRQTLCWTSLAILAKVIVFVVMAVASPYLTGTARAFHFPMRELGAECDRIWSSRFDSPVPYISGHPTYAGSAAWAMKDHPSVHFYCRFCERSNIAGLNTQPTGTWSTDDDVNQKGGIILWMASVPPDRRSNLFSGIRLRDEVSEIRDLPVPDWVHMRFPRAEVLPEILELPHKTGANIPPLRIGIAIIPPPENL